MSEDDVAGPGPAPPMIFGTRGRTDGVDDPDDETFVRFAVSVDADPVGLRTDLAALVDFLAVHRELLEQPGLVESAATFLGDAIITTHPGARWVWTPEREVAGPGVSLVISMITRDVITNPSAGRRLLDDLAEWPQRRRDEAELEALDQTVGGPPLEPVTGFLMPDLAVPTFRTDDGAVIDYGDRFPDGPPDEAYSRVSHPERFAPLHAVAEAVIAFLTEHYEVSVRQKETDRGRAVRLAPANGAPVIITFTDFPGLDLGAGAFWLAHYPSCGCDACDETVEPSAETFVAELFGIVGGGLRERYPVGSQRWTHSSLVTAEGWSSGGSDPLFSAERAQEVMDVLATTDQGHWPAWPARRASPTAVS